MKEEKKYDISDFEVHEITIPIKIEYITCRECESFLIPLDINSIKEITSYISKNPIEGQEDITINYIKSKGGYYKCIECKKIHNINNIEAMGRYPLIYGEPRKEKIYLNLMGDFSELDFLIFIWENIRFKIKDVYAQWRRKNPPND